MHYTLTRLGRLEEEPTALATVTVYSPESAAVTLLTMVFKKSLRSAQIVHNKQL